MHAKSIGSINPVRTFRRGLLLFFLASMFCTSTGCISLVANLINAGWGNKVPAQFPGLAEKRVAVLCVSESSAFGPSTAAREIAQRVEKLLDQNVPDVKMVTQEQIEAWIDRNDWNQIDYLEVGKALNVDMVVAIELGSFSIHEGKTLYKGRSDLQVRVYDMQDGGKEVFEDIPPQIQFPRSTGQPTGDIGESAFRRGFLTIVSQRVARNFYQYEPKSDFGQDATTIGM